MAKKPPAFMFYSANLIADKQYRMMSLAERGLYLSILVECWSNNSVPADTATMARWLGLEPNEVESALTERVESFFSNVNGEFISPDLEDYLEKLATQRNKQSTGGKKGAKRRWEKGSKVCSLASRLPNSLPNGSLNQSKLNQSLPVGTDVDNKSNYNSYKTNHEESTAEKYRIATKGE